MEKFQKDIVELFKDELPFTIGKTMFSRKHGEETVSTLVSSLEPKIRGFNLAPYETKIEKAFSWKNKTEKDFLIVSLCGKRLFAIGKWEYSRLPEYELLGLIIEKHANKIMRENNIVLLGRQCEKTSVVSALVKQKIENELRKIVKTNQLKNKLIVKIQKNDSLAPHKWTVITIFFNNTQSLVSASCFNTRLEARAYVKWIKNRDESTRKFLQYLDEAEFKKSFWIA